MHNNNSYSLERGYITVEGDGASPRSMSSSSSSTSSFSSGPRSVSPPRFTDDKLQSNSPLLHAARSAPETAGPASALRRPFSSSDVLPDLSLLSGDETSSSSGGTRRLRFKARGRLNSALPMSIESVVFHQYNNLTADQKLLLAIAACCGFEFPLTPQRFASSMLKRKEFLRNVEFLCRIGMLRVSNNIVRAAASCCFFCAIL